MRILLNVYEQRSQLRPDLARIWLRELPPHPVIRFWISQNRRHAAPLFFFHTFWDTNLTLSFIFEDSQLELFELYRFVWRHYTPISVEKCKIFGNSFKRRDLEDIAENKLRNTFNYKLYKNAPVVISRKFWILYL